MAHISTYYPAPAADTPDTLLTVMSTLVSANVISPGDANKVILDVGNVAYAKGSTTIGSGTFSNVAGDLVFSDVDLPDRVRPGDTVTVNINGTNHTLTVKDVDLLDNTVTFDGMGDIETDSGTYSYTVAAATATFEGDVLNDDGNIVLDVNDNSSDAVLHAAIDNANDSETLDGAEDLKIWTGVNGSLPPASSRDNGTIYIVR